MGGIESYDTKQVKQGIQSKLGCIEIVLKCVGIDAIFDLITNFLSLREGMIDSKLKDSMFIPNLKLSIISFS